MEFPPETSSPAAPIEPVSADEVRLHTFDPTTIAADRTIMVIGPRNSGKTVIMMDILRCMAAKLDSFVVFCPTADTRKEFEEHVPQACVHKDFSVEALDAIIQTQKDMHELRMSGKESESAFHFQTIGVVLDDCMFDKKPFESKAARYLMMNGRHEGFWFMNGIQYLVDFPKGLRAQVDLVIVFPVEEEDKLTQLRENVLGVFKSNEDLLAVFRSLQPFETLVFDAKAHRERRPALFVYRAQFPTPKFQAGSPFLWYMYYRHMKRRNFDEVYSKMDAELEIAKRGGAPPEAPKGKRFRIVRDGAAAAAAPPPPASRTRAKTKKPAVQALASLPPPPDE